MAGETFLDKGKTLCGMDQLFIDSLTSPWINNLLTDIAEVSPWTYFHSLRVARIAYGLGLALKLPEEELMLLTRAGALHDRGKLSLPHELLNGHYRIVGDKQEIQKHPRVGFNLLGTISTLMYSDDQKLKAEIEKIAEIIVAHQEFEKLNSYPRCDHESHNETPELKLYQALIALADSVDAAMSPRPYESTVLSPQQTFYRIIQEYRFSEIFEDETGVLVDEAINIRKNLTFVSYN